MRVLLAIFLVLFIIQQIQYLRIKNNIKLSIKFSEAYLKFIKLYINYNVLLKEKKLQNLPNTRKILNRVFSNLELIIKVSSFKEIKTYQAPSLEKKKNKKEFELFLKEQENFTKEIEDLLREILELQKIILKSTNKFLYFMYQYDSKIKGPLLLKIITLIIFILENMLVYLQKRKETKINLLENIEKIKKYKNFRDCIV